MRPVFYFLVAIIFCPAAFPATAATPPGISQFIDEMVVKHQFKRADLEKVFARVQYQPAVIDAISRPYTTRPWPEYRAAFVNPRRVQLGLDFWKKYPKSLRRAEREYSVPQEIIVAEIGVETLYGENAGNFIDLDALTTLAFYYPPRAAFFRNELENYLLLAREQGFDLLSVRGSYAGALGIPQFMPSSYRNFAVDFNHNNKIDLLNEASDAIGSVGNYLQSYGWIKGAPVAVPVQITETTAHEEIKAQSLADWARDGAEIHAQLSRKLVARLLDFTFDGSKRYWLGFNNFDVITRYNNSDYYAMVVFQLAQQLKAAHDKAIAQK